MPFQGAAACSQECAGSTCQAFSTTYSCSAMRDFLGCECSGCCDPNLVSDVDPSIGLGAAAQEGDGSVVGIVFAVIGGAVAVAVLVYCYCKYQKGNPVWHKQRARTGTTPMMASMQMGSASSISSSYTAPLPSLGGDLRPL